MFCTWCLIENKIKFWTHTSNSKWWLKLERRWVWEGGTRIPKIWKVDRVLVNSDWLQAFPWLLLTFYIIICVIIPQLLYVWAFPARSVKRYFKILSSIPISLCSERSLVEGSLCAPESAKSDLLSFQHHTNSARFKWRMQAWFGHSQFLPLWLLGREFKQSIWWKWLHRKH